MKKILIWISGIFLVSLLAFWVWSQRPGLPVEQVLPSQPLVFVSLEHVQEHVSQLIKSDFGKSISSIDLPDVLSRNNFSYEDIHELKLWQKDVVGFWKNPLIKDFLGKEVSVAIYRKDDSYQTYMTLRLTFSTRIAELLGQLSHHWGDGVSIKRERYHGRTINHILFKNQGITVSYVRIRDLLIVAPESLGNLDDVVDVYQDQREALKDDPSFNFVRSKAYPSADGLAYINFNRFSRFWRGAMDSKLTLLGYQEAAFPVYGLSYMPGMVSKFKVLVGFDKKYMPSGMRKTLDCPALANDTLKLVPVNAILYSWGGCFDFGQSWDNISQRLAEDPALSTELVQFKDKVEKYFDINIKKDVLPVLGHEIGGYLTDVDMQGNYPFPRLLIFVKIQDRAKAETLLNKITQNPVAALESEHYNQVDIHYTSLSLGANMDPGYAFLGDYLLVATSRQLLKRSIDAYTDSLRSIVSDDTVEQFSLANGEKFHSVTLMKTAELSRRAQDFLGWLDKYLSGQVSIAAAYKQDGNNKKQELDQAIADKNQELALAQRKLNQLKSTSLSEAYIEDPSLVDGAIANINREEESLRGDIATYIEQKEDLARLLDNYALSAQTDILTMYNMENIVSPVLKSLESIDAQAVTVRFGDKILETEFLVK